MQSLNTPEASTTQWPHANRAHMHRHCGAHHTTPMPSQIDQVLGK